MADPPADPTPTDPTAHRTPSRPAASSLAFALSSRRTLAVTLLSFSSGLPLALVWIAVPDWMRNAGIDIRIVGLTTLAHAPWTFKIVWSPLMDRYAIPWMGRRRGWIALSQIALVVLTLLLAGLGDQPDGPWVLLAVCFAIAFASASQDIVVDAYAVDVLRREEQGVAVGARTAVYRWAMFVAGGLAITAAARFSWVWVNIALASLYLPMLAVTRWAPEPEKPIPPARSLRDAIWLPFLGFLGRHRALEILAFVLLYKLADNLAQSLLRPFLVDMGYSDVDRGVALATVGTVMTIAGTFLGGALTTLIGLGHSLWIFGLLQIFSNVGYILVAQSAVSRPLMYGAMSFEMLTTGMGMGAFGVLLLRMTQKRFSATQFALFSSLFGLPRLVAGPVTGFMVHAWGWSTFFWMTMAAGIPGLVMLARFVPPGTREPVFTVERPTVARPLPGWSLVVRALIGGSIGTFLALLIMASVLALDHVNSGAAFGPHRVLLDLLTPKRMSDVLILLGALVFGTVCGLLTAAVVAARRGAGADLEDDLD